MSTTRAAGITAAAGTRLTRPLLLELFRLENSLHKSVGTWSSPIVVSHIVEVSRLLRPVGPGFVSQNPSPGDFSQSPYPSMARGSVKPPTT